MTKVEIITLRMNLLGGMHDYILNVVGDEDYIDVWLAEGVPDGADEDTLEGIARNESLWTEMCRLFGSIVENEYVYRKDED